MKEGTPAEVLALIDDLMAWGAGCIAEARRRPQTAMVRASLQQAGHARLTGEVHPLSLIVGGPFLRA